MRRPMRRRAIQSPTRSDSLALKARNAIIEEDLKRHQDCNAGEKVDGDNQFAGMTLDQLRDFVTTNTGHKPHGSLNRKTLVRMATEAQQKVA